MSEFKFACPVCGQHITADSSTSGGQLECPTCFQKIVVPQAPASGDSKLILSAAQVSKPRPGANGTGPQLEPLQPAARPSSLAGVALLVLLLGGAGAALYVFREKIFKTGERTEAATNQAPKHKTEVAPRTFHPIPTTFGWTSEVTNAVLPDTAASGSIHGSGFVYERAFLQPPPPTATKPETSLTLRQGRGSAPDLGITIYLFARLGEELSGKTVEVGPDRPPPVPRVTLRWRNEQEQNRKEDFLSGYALKLAFGTAANGRMPGKIYLCLPDDAKSFVAGTFEADIRRPPVPKPRAAKPPGPKG